MKHHFYKLRKARYFTLLEVLIALSLGLIVMGVLLFYYFQMSQASIFSEAAAVRSFEMRYLQNRLQDLTLRLLPPKASENAFFFTGGVQPGLFLSGTANLLFSYDNGVVLDQDLSNTVLGRIYVDPEGRLTLMTWVDRKKWEPNSIPRFHREVLLENVTGLAFEFFTGVKDSGSQKTQNLDLLPGRWVEVWRKEYEELPALIRFKIKTKEEKQGMVFAFPLANRQAKVIYKS